MHKPPITLDLTMTGYSGQLAKRYLRAANSCSDQITRGHWISQGVLRVLADEEVELSRLPWLKRGESKILPFDALTNHCLCKAHNSALSGIDAVGRDFFVAIQKCATITGPSHKFVFSGHDIERWLLRTLAAMAASKSFSIDDARLEDDLHPDVTMLDLLQDLGRWQPPTGVYVLHGDDEVFWRQESLLLAPLLASGRKIAGIQTSIQGFRIGLLATGVEKRPLVPDQRFTGPAKSSSRSDR